MPTYRIISELDAVPQHRQPRGNTPLQGQPRLVTIVDAGCLAEAAGDARDTQPHAQRRIIAVEEIHPGLSFTDEQITAALTSDEFGTGEPFIDPQDFAEEDQPLYEQEYFGHTVELVVAALRESNLVPGLNISLLNNPSDEAYAMVEIFDEARNVYLSHGIEMRKITDDQTAVGWSGVLAIARELIWFSTDLH